MRSRRAGEPDCTGLTTIIRGSERVGEQTLDCTACQDVLIHLTWITNLNGDTLNYFVTYCHSFLTGNAYKDSLAFRNRRFGETYILQLFLSVKWFCRYGHWYISQWLSMAAFIL